MPPARLQVPAETELRHYLTMVSLTLFSIMLDPSTLRFGPPRRLGAGEPFRTLAYTLPYTLMCIHIVATWLFRMICSHFFPDNFNLHTQKQKKGTLMGGESIRCVTGACQHCQSKSYGAFADWLCCTLSLWLTSSPALCTLASRHRCKKKASGANWTVGAWGSFPE